MSIYLGDAGHIELQRRQMNNVLTTTLSPDDVDVNSDRFSFDGIESESLLLTGDRVQFDRTDGKPIELVDGVTDVTGVTRYVHVDPMGGIRMYDTFNNAVTGELRGRVQLVLPSTDQELAITIESSNFRCLSQVRSYSITTARETLDLTNLGDEFRRNYASGLINGQGECTCMWDYESTGGGADEFAQYLVQLILRLQLGASFNGHFYVKSEGATPYSGECLGETARDDSIWWEAQCIVTNLAMTFEPGQIINTSIQFITTDQFQLKSGTPPVFLSQDPSGDYIMQDDSGDKIEVERVI